MKPWSFATNTISSWQLDYSKARVALICQEGNGVV